jgi:hypothetical protein
LATSITCDFIALGPYDIDAVVTSFRICAAGVQDHAKQKVAGAQASLGGWVAALKALLTVKSPQETLKLQAKLAHASMEAATAESGCIS